MSIEISSGVESERATEAEKATNHLAVSTGKSAADMARGMPAG